METFYMEQGGDEWFEVKLGIISASNFSHVLGSKSKSGRETYMYKVAGEILAEEGVPSYTNAAMENGNLVEDQARAKYELMNKCDVEQVGFIMRDEFVGCSPDGLVDKDGMLEVKCPQNNTQAKRLDKGVLPSEYVAQIQGQLWVAERQWCDFMSFHPKMKPFIIRVERDDAYIKELEARVYEFSKEVQAVVERCGG